MQVMPAPVAVTVPLPVPALVTVRVLVSRVKFAVTLFAALMVTVQVLAARAARPDLVVFDADEPSQPVQLVKVEPAAGLAVRVTVVPAVNEALQVTPQAMPEGSLVTVPEPDMRTERTT